MYTHAEHLQKTTEVRIRGYGAVEFIGSKPENVGMRMRPHAFIIKY